MSPEREQLIRRLSLNDERTVELVLGAPLGSAGSSDVAARRTRSLVRLAALIAVESPLTSYQWAVDLALAEGATDADILDVLTAVGPVVGSVRLTAAAAKILDALGLDLDPSIEP